ncbi:MAG TPA: metal-sulfur cluster assembly factor [Longimicrobiales bacterium]|nr:metal-sulfur cluster assembly factor [Longimicrobiales bacterium]
MNGAVPPVARVSGAVSDTPLTADSVRHALRGVIDPEVGLDVVTLGLIYDVGVSDDTVIITYTLTTPGCPLAAYIANAMRHAAEPLLGGRALDLRLVYQPPWTPDLMEDGAW